MSTKIFFCKNRNLFLLGTMRTVDSQRRLEGFANRLSAYLAENDIAETFYLSLETDCNVECTCRVSACNVEFL